MFEMSPVQLEGALTVPVPDEPSGFWTIAPEWSSALQQSGFRMLTPHWHAPLRNDTQAGVYPETAAGVTPVEPGGDTKTEWINP